MAKLKFVTDVSNFALLRGLARTRTRLVVSALLALAATYAFGFWSAHYIFEVSGSVVVNMFLITGNMLAMLVASFLLTVLFGDLAFPGPWRETIFLETDPGDLARAPVKNHSGEFLVILVLLILANAFGLNYATGGFLAKYHRVGYFRVLLRSDQVERRVRAYDNLTQDSNYPLWSYDDVQQLILDGFDDPAADVRAAAAWSAGRVEIDRARPRLIELLDDSSAEVSASAAVSLGKLPLSVRTRRAVERTLATADSPVRKIGAIRGLGLMRSEQSVDPLLPFIDSDRKDVRYNALWALRRIGSEEARDPVWNIIEGDPSKRDRCAAYDTLKKVATDEDVIWAVRRYQEGSFPPPCEPRVWTERDGTKHRILIGDSFRVKLVKIVANHAPRDHRNWFERIARDPEAPGRLREVASTVLRKLRRAE